MENYRDLILARVDREPPPLDMLLAPRAAESARSAAGRAGRWARRSAPTS